ncbi:hypothetical protein SCP_0606510 [Sparassis crispa]|uniref:F-box domain-containing protein n=1 Tax=Sparassis crispa TaxID=139825 RepID=A0A401GR30_9APHY|nr:hypothetical protein SCP_0606510 [Sparassis crispa]GBE84672.1 hypothetical protein SCP_0606510 [Sparassis crispa]
MDSLVPLVKVLGNSVARVRVGNTDGDEDDDRDDDRDEVFVYIRRRQVSSDQWARLCSYAHRIHAISLHDYQKTVDPSLLAHLVFLAGGQPLFPTLSMLRFRQLNAAFGREIMAFLSTSLKHVEISVGSLSTARPKVRESNAVRRFLWGLHSTATDLKHFSFSTVVKPPFIDNATSFPKVEYLDLLGCHSSTQMISSCANLEQLTELWVCLRESDNYGVPSCVGFPVLEDLVFSGLPAQIPVFLNLISSPSLGAFKYKDRILDRRVLGMPDYLDAFDLIGSKFATTLTCLVMDFPEFVDNSPVRLMNHIHPLLNIRQLEILELALIVRVELTSDDLHAMATSWTKLTHICIAAYPFVESLPSVCALASFGRHCPGLVHMQLPGVETRTPPSLDLQLPNSHGLNRLCFAGPNYGVENFDVPVSNPLPVAQFLHGLFPKLSYLSLDSLGHRWGEVELIYMSLKNGIPLRQLD